MEWYFFSPSLHLLSRFCIYWLSDDNLSHSITFDRFPKNQKRKNDPNIPLCYSLRFYCTLSLNRNAQTQQQEKSTQHLFLQKTIFAKLFTINPIVLLIQSHASCYLCTAVFTYWLHCIHLFPAKAKSQNLIFVCSTSVQIQFQNFSIHLTMHFRDARRSSLFLQHAMEWSLCFFGFALNFPFQMSASCINDRENGAHLCRVSSSSNLKNTYLWCVCGVSFLILQCKYKLCVIRFYSFVLLCTTSPNALDGFNCYMAFNQVNVYKMDLTIIFGLSIHLPQISFALLLKENDMISYSNEV